MDDDSSLKMSGESESSNVEKEPTKEGTGEVPISTVDIRIGEGEVVSASAVDAISELKADGEAHTEKNEQPVIDKQTKNIGDALNKDTGTQRKNEDNKTDNITATETKNSTDTVIMDVTTTRNEGNVTDSVININRDDITVVPVADSTPKLKEVRVVKVAKTAPTWRDFVKKNKMCVVAVAVVFLLVIVGIFFLVKNVKGEPDFDELDESDEGEEVLRTSPNNFKNRGKRITTVTPVRRRKPLRKLRRFNSGGCVPASYNYPLSEPHCYKESTYDKCGAAYQAKRFQTDLSAWKLPYAPVKAWKQYIGNDGIIDYAQRRGHMFWHGEGHAYGCGTYLQVSPKLSYNAALRFCNRYNYSLYTFDTEAELCRLQKWMNSYVKKECKGTYGCSFSGMQKLWIAGEDMFSIGMKSEHGKCILGINFKDEFGRPIGGPRKYCRDNNFQQDSVMMLDINHDCFTIRSKTEGIFFRTEVERPFLCKKCGIFGSETCDDALRFSNLYHDLL